MYGRKEAAAHLFLTLTLVFPASDYAGDIGPFQLAIALTALSMCIIFFWRENYGHCEPEEGVFSITSSIGSSVKIISKR